ncbi:MAG: DNRLRE domain-containing protein [Verrucomicrobiota bacterium]
MRSLFLAGRSLFTLALFCSGAAFPAGNALAASTTVMISQVYGGGGNSGATYKNDFIELHNISSTAVNVSTWSVQYAAATGNSWQVTTLSGSIAPGGYYLVQESAGTGGTTSLPAPDASGSIAMSSTAGKVAVVSSTTALNVADPTTAVDLVGYGTANGFEGSGAAPTLTNTTSDSRKDNGSTDTDNNVQDFTAGTVTPRNSATAPYFPSVTATQVIVETAANGSGTTVPAQAIFTGRSLTVYAVSRSGSNSYAGNVAATWSLSAISGGVVAGDLVPSADGTSAVFTGHVPGSAVITATVSGLTSVSSGAITVNPLPATISGVGASSAARVASSQNTVLSVNVTPAGNPPSTGITVTADLSAFGGSASTQLYDDGTHGDTTAGDGIYSLSEVVPPGQAGGAYSVPVTITDAQGRSSSASITFNVLGSFAIYHTNDTHARITPHDWIVPAHGPGPDVYQKVGGAAYMGAKILSLTAANTNCLVLDGGDISEGNPIGDYNNGPDVTTPGNAGVVGFFQLLSQKLKAQPRGRGIDAFVVGNHDVRYANYINNLKNQTDFPVISINVCQHGTHTPYFQPYVIVTVNGTKIGIVGYTTESSVVGPDLTNTIDIVPCDWSSSNSSYVHLADTVNDLRNNQGCDLVILLTHDGQSDLCTTQSGKANGPVLADTPAAKIPEIAITGHWHTWCESVWEPSILNYKTIFMESSSFIKYVGELQVTGAGKYVSSVQYPLLDSEITPDPDIATYVQNEKNLYNSNTTGPQADQALGYTADDLVLDKKMKWWSADEYPWTGDDSAGGYICDGLKWKAAQLFGSCDLSIEVGGGVRSDIQAGPMTFTNLYEVYPWNDDLLWMVKMTGQEIWNFIQSNNCDAGISREWHVTAVDGVLTSLTYNGSPVNLSATYNVAISNYIYQTNTFSDQNPSTSTYLARTALMDYAQLFPQSTPYTVGGPRYTLNTDFAGGYRAVVLMMNDNDSAEDFDDGFIRLLSATPETVSRLGTDPVPTSLVNPDGTVNHGNRLSEIEWYRSFLGFKPGALKPGDIVEIYGKGGFYNGDPEFVDSEGIISDGVEFNVVGHDATLAQPEYYSSINAFYNDTFKNHYVKFFAKKTGNNTVVDAAGTSMTVMDVTAYSAKTLPGSVGDLLQLTGIPTDENYALRFRCDTAVLASSVGVTNFPPTSQVSAIPSGTQTGAIQLTASASVAPFSSVNTVSLTPVADAEVASGKPTSNFGSSSDIYIQSANGGSYGNERGWLKFDLSSLPAGSNIAGARLVMFCWSATGASLPTGVSAASTDSWTETGLTWNNQPGFGNPISTVALSSGATNVSYSWDVTQFVQSEFAGDKTVSLVVKAITENSSDATWPSYGFDSKEYGSNSPVLQVDTPSNVTAPTLASVQFFYRFSTDGITFGDWTSIQTVTSGPYSVSFNFPNGAGYYQFYSVATDSNGNVEPNPALYDASTTFDVNTTPAASNATDTPTLPMWGLIGLGALLFGYAATQIRTRLHLFLFLVLGLLGALLLLSVHPGPHPHKLAQVVKVGDR